MKRMSSEGSSVDRFEKTKKLLQRCDATELLETFQKEGIDDDALSLLDLNAMKELGVPLGIRLKLRSAIEKGELLEHKEEMEMGVGVSSSSSVPMVRGKHKKKYGWFVEKLIRWAPGIAVFVLMSPIGAYLLYSLWSDYHSGLTNNVFAAVAALYFLTMGAAVAGIQILWLSRLARIGVLPVTVPDGDTEQRRKLHTDQDDETPAGDEEKTS